VSTSATSGVAGRYASALFELADTAKSLDAVAQDLTTFRKLVAESADLARLIASPVIARSLQGKALLAVLDAAGRAVERARAGGGATLLNMETYRHGGHHVGDAEEYRSAAEVASFASSNDPIDRFVPHAIDGGLMAVEEVRDVVDEVERLVDEAHRFALQSPPPDPATALDDVWTTGVPR